MMQDFRAILLSSLNNTPPYYDRIEDIQKLQSKFLFLFFVFFFAAQNERVNSINLSSKLSLKYEGKTKTISYTWG